MCSSRRTLTSWEDPCIPSARANFGRAVAAVTSSALGMPGRFHYARTRIDTDHVYLGMWKRSTLLELGGFDARHFPWVGEDYELSYRIRCNGGRVVCDPAVRSDYTPRETPVALWRQYNRYGLAKASSLETHRALPSWRPVAPAALVAVTIIGLFAGRTWRRRSAVPAIHALGCGVIGHWVSRRESSDPLRAALVQEICHWSYGLGLWRGDSTHGPESARTDTSPGVSRRVRARTQIGAGRRAAAARVARPDGTGHLEQQRACPAQRARSRPPGRPFPVRS